MAKAKAKKPAPKAKPAPKKAAQVKKVAPAKKAAPIKKAAPAKKSAAVKKAAPAKKAAAVKKAAPAKKVAPAKKPVVLKKAAPAQIVKKAVAMPELVKKAAPIPAKMREPIVAPKAKVQPVIAVAPTPAPVKGAIATPKLASISRPVKPLPIPSEVLKLKDKASSSEPASNQEKREIHQSDIFSEEELGMFLETLKNERSAVLEKARAAVDSGNIALDKDEMYDEVDLASATVDQNLTFRLLDRDRKLLSEIEHAMQKIQTGDFGYCEGTGEPIPKRRLELRPWCRHSVKYKEQLEKLEKSGRGVVDEDAEMLD